MNKQEAAALLGVSQRTLENYLAKGRVSARYVKGKTRDVADFDRAELLRLKEELAQPQGYRPAVEGQGARGGALVTKTPNRESLGRFSELRELAEVLRPAPPPPVSPLPPKLALTLGEAAEYSGLGVGAIKAAVEAKTLKASKLGPRGAWVVKRSDLEAWVKRL